MIGKNTQLQKEQHWKYSQGKPVSTSHPTLCFPLPRYIVETEEQTLETGQSIHIFLEWQQEREKWISTAQQGAQLWTFGFFQRL